MQCEPDKRKFTLLLNMCHVNLVLEGGAKSLA